MRFTTGPSPARSGDLRLEKLESSECEKQKCGNISRHPEASPLHFRKPSAYHRLPFMPPFAGDIGVGPGSLKCIAQIPRNAYRWSLGRGSKCCGGVSNVRLRHFERLLLMFPPRQDKLERPLILGDPCKRTKTRSGSGVVCNFVVGCSRMF